MKTENLKQDTRDFITKHANYFYSSSILRALSIKASWHEIKLMLQGKKSFHETVKISEDEMIDLISKFSVPHTYDGYGDIRINENRNFLTKIYNDFGFSYIRSKMDKFKIDHDPEYIDNRQMERLYDLVMDLSLKEAKEFNRNLS